MDKKMEEVTEFVDQYNSGLITSQEALEKIAVVITDYLTGK